MDSTGFQLDYVSYLRNMAFIIILLVIMSYILVKLKSGKQLPKLSGLSLLNLPNQVNDNHIEIVERNVLEGRKSIYLVKVFEDQYWLIGTTETSIQALGEVKAPPSPTQEFSSILEQHEEQDINE